MKRKIADILVILFIILNLTGCYSYREINKITFATSVIFDRDEHDEIVLYLDCVRPYRDANDSSDKGRRIMFKGRGRTALEAIRDINVSSSNTLDFSQVRAYIFTENAAKEGIKNYIDLINNDQQFGFKPYMFVYTGDVKALLDVTNKDEEYLGLYLDQLIQKNNKNGKVIKSNVNDYISSTLTGSKNSFMSVIELKNDDIESRIELNGGAIMHDNKMVERLKAEDVLTYNMLMKNVGEGTFQVPNPYDTGKFVTFDILDETNNTDITFDEDNIVLKKDIDVRVTIGEIQGKLEVNQETLDIMKLSQETKLKKYEEEFFEEYKEKDIDILGVNRILEEKYPYSDIENFLEKTILDVNVNIIIDGSSLTRNSL